MKTIKNQLKCNSVRIYGKEPKKDYDTASFAITRSMRENIREPKESFHRIAGYYSEH